MSDVADKILKNKEESKVKKLHKVIEDLQDLKMYDIISDRLFMEVTPKLIRRSFELEYNENK